MAVTINASTTTGLVQSADTSGIIELQNNGTTKLTVNSSGATIPTAIVTTLSDGTNSTSATNCIQGSAKAWVTFAGASGTISSSYNVSSVTRRSTGRYTVNLTNAMSNSNYAIIGWAYGSATQGTSAPLTAGDENVAQTTTAYSIFSFNISASPIDQERIYTAIFA